MGGKGAAGAEEQPARWWCWTGRIAAILDPPRLGGAKIRLNLAPSPTLKRSDIPGGAPGGTAFR